MATREGIREGIKEWVRKHSIDVAIHSSPESRERVVEEVTDQLLELLDSQGLRLANGESLIEEGE